MRQFEIVGFDDLDYRRGHIRLVLYGGHNVIFVLDFGFLHIPADGDGLIAQTNNLGGGGSRVNQDIVLVGLMLVGCDIDLVIALRQVNREESVAATLALCYQGSGDGILQHNLSTADVGLLFRIVRKFVGDVNDQRTSLVRDGCYVEVDIGSVTILAVDAKPSGDRHIELHVGSRSHAQYDGCRVVLVQAGHGGSRQSLHPFGQSQGNLTGVALAIVADAEAVVAPCVLVHRGDQVLLLDNEVTHSRAGIVVDGDFKESTLGRGDAHLERQPVVALSRRCACYLISQVNRCLALNVAGNSELGLTALGRIHRFGSDTAQRQCTGILYPDDTVLRLAYRHVAGDITVFGTLQAIDVKGSQFLCRWVALEAGSHGEVPRLQGVELPFQREPSGSIGGDLSDIAGSGIDHIDVDEGIDGTVAANLSGNGYHVALAVNLLVGLYGSGEG